MIYLTSDWHLNHNKKFVYGVRGFNSVEEMNEGLITRHNRLVTPEDDVYVLGDCCLGGPESLDANKKLIERFNGNLHIIFGNHDTNRRIDMYTHCKNVVELLGYSTMLKYKKWMFYLSHYPTLTSNFDNKNKPLKAQVINLCGHSHTKYRFNDLDKGLIYHVEPEAHSNYPVLLDDIIEELRQVKNNEEKLDTVVN